MKYWYVEVPITEDKFCKRFDSPEEARKEVDRIQSDYPTLEQLAEAGYKLERTFPNETSCRPQLMFYGKEEER